MQNQDSGGRSILTEHLLITQRFTPSDLTWEHLSVNGLRYTRVKVESGEYLIEMPPGCRHPEVGAEPSVTLMVQIPVVKSSYVQTNSVTSAKLSSGSTTQEDQSVTRFASLLCLARIKLDLLTLSISEKLGRLSRRMRRYWG